MHRALIFALLAGACGSDDDGFGPPPPSPDSDPIGPGEGAGPVGVMTSDTGDDASSIGTAGTGGSAGSDDTMATDGSDGTMTGGAATCQVELAMCEGDGVCMYDFATDMLVCSHGAAGEPCLPGGVCQLGLFCFTDEFSGGQVCTPR
jgi:hypothetical protein